MYALFVVLNQTDYLDDLLENFVEAGVKGATVLDSQGMASAIVNSGEQRIPLFGSLKTLMEGARPYNKTVFTVLESEAMVEKAVAAVQEALKDLPPTGLGFMFTVPVAKTYALRPES
ncbi:MAG: P-II family nitrogen regulator [Limnochordia bacterium]